MFSALQGKSSSPKINPYAGLHSPSITARCAHVKSCISTLQIKELHQFFPYLLSNIFNFDKRGGWGLRTFNRNLHSDFPHIKQFLAPGGELFQLIANLDSKSFIYEFPIGCLPQPSKQALTEGIVPPFYTNKVQLSYSVDNAPTHIFLSAFEYFFFHFAYYLIHVQQNQWTRPATTVTDSLYTHLFEAYVMHYLPFTGTIPFPLTSISSQGSPPHYYHSIPQPGLSPSSQFSWGAYGHLSDTSLSSGSNLSQHEMETVVHSEIFVQILVEFWLNQNTYNGGQGNLLSQEQTRFFPSEEQYILLRRLLKQVLYFSNGSSYSTTSMSTLQSSFIPITEELRSSIVVLFFQKKMYSFLKHSLKHSPLDLNYRNIIELWLTYIQPWRYLDPAKESAENKANLKNYPEKWRVYVLDNFPFYSTLLVLFLSRCFQIDLVSNANHVFSQPGLMGFVELGEALLLNPDSSRTSPHKHSPRTAANNIKAVFVNCDGPMFQYTSLFEPDTIEAVQSMLIRIKQAKAILTQRRLSSSQPHPSTPSPPTSPAHSLPSTPTSTMPISQGLVGAQPSKKSWMHSLWDGMVELFSDEPSGPVPMSTPVITDPKKMIDLLDRTEENFTNMFKLSEFQYYIPPSHGGSPVLGKAVPLSAMPTPFPGDTHHNIMSSPPPSITPEYLEGTSRLSPRGKMQVIQGLRKCSNMNVQHLGDPLLQPIRSFENATLVRTLHQISCGLNDKFAPQLAAIGASKSLMCKLLTQLLAPPPPLPFTALIPDIEIDEDKPPTTPTTKVSSVITPPLSTSTLSLIQFRTPRINLRPLGSYYTLTYLLLGILMARILSLPLWLCVLFVLGFMFLYCIFSYMLNRGNKTKIN